jgi:hypothetical protein
VTPSGRRLSATVEFNEFSADGAPRQGSAHAHYARRVRIFGNASELYRELAPLWQSVARVQPALLTSTANTVYKPRAEACTRRGA